MSLCFSLLDRFLSIQPLKRDCLQLVGLTAFFAIVTLPVEFDASNRAMKMLESSNILVGDELRGARKVLDAAALTYVAAAAQAILTLLYYIIRVTSLGRRNDD